MTNDGYLLLVLLSIFVPIVLFGLVALMSKPASSKSSFEDEFMLAGRDVNKADFINSATGYMLQVSTTFYYIYWGYNYGFSNIFYLASWAIGIVLFAMFAPELVQFRNKFKSLPEFLSGGDRSSARIVTAIATVISFIGVFYVESYFTTDFITNIATPNTEFSGATNVWWVIFSSLTLLVLLYSSSGGLRKVIVTDTWQLAGAYLGLSVVFSYLLNKSFQVDVLTSTILAVLCIIIYLALLYAGRNTNEGIIKPGSLIFGTVILLFIAVKGISSSSASTESVNIYGMLKQVSEPWGWVTLLGFTVINIVWQFCDNSNFQRIGALKLPDKTSVAEIDLKRSIRKLIIVSPLTWGLGIIFGMLIKSAAITVAAPGSEYQALVSLLKHEALGGSIMAMIVIFGLITSLISIMMSTCDTALVAAIQVIHKDLQKKLELNRLFLTSAALFTILMVGVIAFVHKATGNASILKVMAGVYSVILVLFPISWSVLHGRIISSKQAVASVSLSKKCIMPSATKVAIVSPLCC